MKGLSKRLSEYCDNTTIHGPKYLAQPGRPGVEKCLWFVTIVLGIGFGSFLTTKILNKLESSPVITTLDSTNYPLSQIPFPAVTICPNYKGIKDKVLTETCKTGLHHSGNSTVVNELIYSAIAPIVNLDWDDSDYFFEVEDKINITETVNFLKKISPRCKDYVLTCLWNSKSIDCSKHFRLASTDVGFCCSFNLVPPLQNLNDVGIAESISFDYDYYSLDNYDDYGTNESFSNDDVGIEFDPRGCIKTPLDYETDGNGKPVYTISWDDTCDYLMESYNVSQTQPTKSNSSTNHTFELRNATGTGVANGLSILVDTMRCGWLPSTLIEGVKIYVHEPDAFPEVGQRGVIMSANTVNQVAVSAIVTETTSAAVNTYENTTRNCNYGDERKLDYYSKYSRSNCEIEARVNQYQAKCGCKPYYYPGNFSICGGAGMECINNISTILENNCLPVCNEITYKTAVTSAQFSTDPVNYGTLKLHARAKKPLNDLVWINVFFPDSTVFKYKRDQLYAFEDIISNIGGSLGLCLGFSLVSVVEFVYFFCIRPFSK